MKQATSILLALACVLTYMSVAQAECCRASLTMSYTIGNGNCADAGGRGSGDHCTITVCADGRAQVGTYCGRGSCNIFGCACKNGCITGNWKQSFLDNNNGRNVNVRGEKWNG